MKKILSILALLVLVSSQAFAITYTVSSREDFTNAKGESKVRVYGTIAMDSSYPCNSTTKICGEVFLPAQIGMSAINQVLIDPPYSNVVGAAGGVFFLRYHATGSAAANVASEAGVTSYPNIRAYYTQAVPSNGPVINGPLVSMPSYDLSALTAVPFEAIGSL
jgi:hypothetical protein